MPILTIFRFFSLASSAPPMPFPHDPGFLFVKFFRLPLTFETLIITSSPLFAFHFCSQGGKELEAAQLVRVTSWGTCSSHIKKHPIWQFVCSLDLQKKPIIQHLKTFYLLTWILQNPLIWRILQESSSPLDLASAEEMETDQLMKWAIKLPFVFHLFFLPSPSRNI